MGLLPKDKYLGGGTTPQYTGHTLTVPDRRRFSVDVRDDFPTDDGTYIPSYFPRYYYEEARGPLPKDKYLGGGTTPRYTGHTPTVFNGRPFSCGYYNRRHDQHLNSNYNYSNTQAEQLQSAGTASPLLSHIISVTVLAESVLLLLLKDTLYNMIAVLSVMAKSQPASKFLSQSNWSETIIQKGARTYLQKS